MTRLVRMMPATLLITSKRRHDTDLFDADAIHEVNQLLRDALKRRRRDPNRYRLRTYESPAAGLKRPYRRAR